MSTHDDDNCPHLVRASLLEAENARLKAEVERLSQPAVIGGYNLSQYIRMANSETLEFDNGDIFADMTLPERIKYIVESHASLKAEVERLKEDNRQLTKAFEIAEGIIKRMGKAAEDATKEGKQP
jgi:FtsZ-binding cell division protein ZapB